MDNETMDKIRERIIRYVDEYGWNWVMVRKQINAYFGTALSAEQLRNYISLAKRRGVEPSPLFHWSMSQP